MILLAAIALPALLWERPLDTVKTLKDAGISEIAVAADKVAAWKSAGFAAVPIPSAGCVAAPAPKVNMRANVARATSSPWVDSNSWRFLRNPGGKFCIEALGRSAGLAAAEAFAYGVEAYIKTDDAGLASLAAMIKVLRGVPVLAGSAAPVADIGVVDDGSAQAGEMLNLLSRRNLLYRIVKSPDSGLKVNVAKVDGGDPSKQAYEIRQKLGDERRSLRLYGSEVVIARLTTQGGGARVHLVNYSQRAVNGLRVRVVGTFTKAELRGAGLSQADLTDLVQADGGTEFTVATMNDYAVIDLAAKP